MEVGIYAIKRNLDFFKVDEENIYMDFLLSGSEDEAIKNTLYSLAAYNLPMDAVELYRIGYFDTQYGVFSPVSFDVEIKDDDDYFQYIKVYIDMQPYVKTYEYFVSEIKKLSEAEIPVELKEEVKKSNGKKELVPDDV